MSSNAANRQTDATTLGYRFDGLNSLLRIEMDHPRARNGDAKIALGGGPVWP
jgi:hypothetical protein